jgi:endonuclease YncB( thermonuclease family)
MGIDTPESRTLDRVEKLFGKLAGERVRELLTGDVILRTQINKSGEDMKGKFGRILGDFVVDGRMLTDILVEEGYAVKYHGQNKDEISSAHLSNRKKLLDEGKVTDLQIKDAKERTRQGK